MKHTWGRRLGVVIAVGIIILTVGLILKTDEVFAKDKAIAVPRVVDANDKLVGPVIGQLSIANPVVALTIPVPNMIVQVMPNQFVGTYPLYFTTVDCSGQPYFNNFYFVIYPHLYPAVGVASGILYGPRGNSAPVSITFSSVQNIYSGACDGFGGEPSPPIDAVIADSIIDLSTQFTPPFRFVYP